MARARPGPLHLPPHLHPPPRHLRLLLPPPPPPLRGCRNEPEGAEALAGAVEERQILIMVIVLRVQRELLLVVLVLPRDHVHGAHRGDVRHAFH